MKDRIGVILRDPGSSLGDEIKKALKAGKKVYLLKPRKKKK